MQTFTGKQYLGIDIANNFGLDKKKWDERLDWFQNNEHRLMELITEADEPALFYAGMLAWEAAKAGTPTGYMISLDATSSGLQILAALTGDRQAAELCNVVSTGKREDAYSNVYNVMLAYLGEDGKISRDDLKKAIMTSLYGSKAQPKEIFGEGPLLDLFYEVMAELAPGAWELNQAFLDMWQEDATCNSWVLPDNFHVHVKVMDTQTANVHFLNQPFEIVYKVNRATEEGRSLGANVTHSIDGMIVREVTRRCDYDLKKIEKLWLAVNSGKYGLSLNTREDHLVTILWNHYKECGYLSARILDYLNADNLGHVEVGTIRHLLLSLPSKPFKVVSVHDCFRVHPNFGNDIRHQYNLQLQMIAKSELLSFIVSQIIKRPVKIGKVDPELWVDILDAEYALS